jgi:hypothetical protein
MTKEILTTKYLDYLNRLRRNDPDLTVIDLRGINITDTGAKDLAEALKVNQTLTQIDLRGNEITGTGVELLTSLLNRNKKLQPILPSQNREIITENIISEVLPQLPNVIGSIIREYDGANSMIGRIADKITPEGNETIKEIMEESGLSDALGSSEKSEYKGKGSIADKRPTYNQSKTQKMIISSLIQL